MNHKTSPAHSSETQRPPNLPLAGQVVLVTRPADQADSLTSLLQAEGATVAVHPAIEILPPESWDEVDRCLESLDAWQTIVFVSANGVDALLLRAGEKGFGDRIRNLETVAIGSGTARALAEHGIKCRSVPGKSDSAGVATWLIDHRPDNAILIVRANRGSQVLPDALDAAGMNFRQIAAYRSVDRKTADAKVLSDLSAGKIDWVTLTSSAIARACVNMFGDSLGKARLASISPTTSAAIAEAGFTVAAEAKEYDMPGIVSAIIQA